MQKYGKTDSDRPGEEDAVPHHEDDILDGKDAVLYTLDVLRCK